MDDRNFHRRFVDSLKQRDWQLGALLAVPLAGFLFAEIVAALVPDGPIEDRCAREVRSRITDRLLFGAMMFDVGPTTVAPAGDGSLTVEIDIRANGIPMRVAYSCVADARSDPTLRRLWTRRV